MIKVEATVTPDNTGVMTNVNVEGHGDGIVKELIAVNIGIFQCFEIPKEERAEFLATFFKDLLTTYKDN